MQIFSSRMPVDCASQQPITPSSPDATYSSSSQLQRLDAFPFPSGELLDQTQKRSLAHHTIVPSNEACAGEDPLADIRSFSLAKILILAHGRSPLIVQNRQRFHLKSRSLLICNRIFQES